jgi:hypothetical protein
MPLCAQASQGLGGGLKIEVSIVWCKSELYVWILTLLVFEEMLCDVDEDIMPSIEYVPIKEEPVSEQATASTQESLSQLSLVKEEEGQ